ncbi:N-acylneuraminate cytidylyltransferase [Ectothiorhodosinus mongolicus]|uniref:N-acylneuraminate cytidylyltransferase n=1 Tax=Ectothiorhodosinus mongolicus TaxID=233100 RepID=A0A1R3VWU0_9GAMM|nr:acylneuraminate cytidylyltransferase family protein [Ectothiorhodosinus mongolicus]ULX56799.1 acylneuraminate cytidylyltransferase family protein [Ectothiorhodosinus mongolicus]SIT68368.1 N-acylneuraminate cytidylyltransferase [Ectothiorhodosinus mongolicus]
MAYEPNVIAFIFARCGSKGLPGKNIRPLNSKPLIAWAIEHAKAVKRIRRVIVSTDCQEIATVAAEYGAEVPFLRPDELATDSSPEWLAWRHALEFVQKEDGSYPDVMVSVPVTAPLRLPQDIERCLDLYFKNECDAVITVTEPHRNPYFNMVKEKSDGRFELVISASNGIPRRQDAPTLFDMTTVAYVMSPKFVMENDSLFLGRVRAVHVPIERAIDIDSLLDFQIAELLMNKRQGEA